MLRFIWQLSDQDNLNVLIPHPIFSLESSSNGCLKDQIPQLFYFRMQGLSVLIPHPLFSILWRFNRPRQDNFYDSPLTFHRTIKGFLICIFVSFSISGIKLIWRLSDQDKICFYSSMPLNFIQKKGWYLKFFSSIHLFFFLKKPLLAQN